MRSFVFFGMVGVITVRIKLREREKKVGYKLRCFVDLLYQWDPVHGI